MVEDRRDKPMEGFETEDVHAERRNHRDGSFRRLRNGAIRSATVPVIGGITLLMSLLTLSASLPAPRPLAGVGSLGLHEAGCQQDGSLSVAVLRMAASGSCRGVSLGRLSLRGGGVPGDEMGGNAVKFPGVVRIIRNRVLRQGDKMPIKKLPIARVQSTYLPVSPMAAMSVAFYIATSLGMTLINKQIFVQFPYPLVVTAFQLVVSLVLLWAFGIVGTYLPIVAFAPPPEFDPAIVQGVLPLTFLYIAMLSTTNYCLQYVDISFYQILRSLVIPINLLYSFLRYGNVPNPVVLASCTAVMLGFILGSVTELNFSTHGFIAGVLSSMFVAMYSITVKSTLPLVGGNTWRLMQYTTGLSLFMVTPALMATGEWTAAVKEGKMTSPHLLGYMSVAGVLGFLINLAYFALIKYASPLSTHISGCVKAALQTVLGVIIFGNTVLPFNAIGIGLTLVGSAIYSLERLKR